MKLSVNVYAAAEGGYWAEVPALKGCYTQGETIQEIEENVREAIALWLEVVEEFPLAEATDPVFRKLEVVV